MLEARVRRKHKEECQTRHLENPKGRTKRGERGVCSRPGADQGQPAARAARRASSRIPAVLVGRTKEGRTGCAADPGLTRASRQPGWHGGQAAGFLQSSWGSPGLLTGAKGVSQSTGHVALSATYFPRGTGWQRPSHSCQGYTFSFPGGTWSRLACRLFEYLSSVILRRAVTHAEKGRNWALDAPDSSASPVVSVIPLPHGCQKDLCSLLISCFFLFRKGCAPSPRVD